MAAAVVGAGCFALYLRQTRHDAHFLSIASRQPVLAEGLRAWAEMLAIGYEEARRGLRESVAEFDSSLTALLEGGGWLGARVDPAPPEVQDDLVAVMDRWGRLRPELDAVAILPRTDPRFDAAYRRIEDSIGDLRDAAHRVLVAFNARVDRLRLRMRILLTALAAPSALVFVVGLWVTRRLIAEPVLQLDETAKRIASSVPASWLLVDRDLRVRQANRHFLERCHTEEGAIIGRPICEVLGIPDLEVPLREVLATNGVKAGLRYSGHFPSDHEPRLFRIALAGTRVADDQEDEQEEVLVVVEDFTEEECLAARARALESRFQGVVQAASDAIILTEADGTISHFNAAAERAFGWRRDEAVGRPFTMLMPEKHRESVRGTLREYIAVRGESSVPGKILKLEGLRKDGTVFPVELTVSSYRVGERVEFCGIVRDMTEREVLEEHLRQVQKLEVVGQLAGGMAHDFNNLLTTILATVELAAGELPRGSQVLSDLAQIKQAALSGASLTRKILAFSRRARLDVQTLDLDELLGRFLELVRRLVPENIDIKTHLDAADMTIRADPGAIEQILINVVTNARDAMPQGGTLIIQTTATTLDEEFCRREGWGAPGRYVVLAVSDTGVGMDEQTRRRIFEPFYTTKPVGQGTGLGMAMVYGLVKQHQGFVHVYSEVDVGTTVRVYFPAVAGDAGIRAAPQRAGMRGGDETILLVEDDPSVRHAAERILTKHGYRVLLASDGRDALERIRSAPSGIDLLIIDVVMPQLSGPQLLEELQSEGRSVRVLMTSGYPQMASDVEAAVPYLAKPWTAEELLRAVRAALDA